MSIGKVMARHWGEAGGMGRPVVSQDTVRVIQASPAKQRELQELHWIKGRF